MAKVFRPKRYFTLNEERRYMKGDPSTEIINQLKLTEKQMEKLLDSIPANKPNHISQKVKKTVWGWF